MIRSIVKLVFSDHQQLALKRRWNAGRIAFVNRFRSYDSGNLIQALGKVGVENGDTVMVHSNFPPDSGFTGNPAEMVEALLRSVGDSGNLMMVSIPFRGGAADYLEKEKVFDVNRTVSMMGLVSEIFRRRRGTMRSLHPTHPVIVSGHSAAEIVADHELCDFPCGVGSPFEALREKDGKILFVDVPFGAMTFFHYLEDLFKERLSIPVYEDALYVSSVKNTDGDLSVVSTYAFRRNVSRDTKMLEDELNRRNLLRRARVGGSSLICVNCEDVVNAMKSLIDRGEEPLREQV